MMTSSGIYGRFVRFLLPLAITLVIVELGIQVLSAGMARVPRATETLAAYGIAWGLILLFNSPLTHAKAVSLVMADSPQACRKVLRFVVALSLLMILGLAALALMPFSHWIIEDVHDVTTNMGNTVRFAILYLVPAPLLTGLSNYFTGQLLRARRTITVSLASVGSIGCGIAVIFLLLPTPLIQEKPIWLPVLATYVNLSVELAIVFWATMRLSQQIRFPQESNHLKRQARPENGTTQAGLSSPTYREIFHFIWPLSLNISFQEFSRPLINMFIARGPNGVESLAVLTVAYALGQFPYRWLNDLRNLMVAFQHEENSFYYIRRFAIACGVVSLAMMLGLFWTPLADVILRQLMGLDADFAALCRIPLMIFAAFSFTVVLRSYSQGIAFIERRTYLIVYCAPARLAAVWLTLVVLPLLGVYGAPLGVSALAVGFLAEAVTLWWGVRGYGWFQERRRLSSAYV